MEPVKIANAAICFKPPLNWDTARDGECAELWVRITPEGYHESAWRIEEHELAALMAGKPIILRIVGGQPTVALYVETEP